MYCYNKYVQNQKLIDKNKKLIKKRILQIINQEMDRKKEKKKEIREKIVIYRKNCG